MNLSIQDELKLARHLAGICEQLPGNWRFQANNQHPNLPRLVDLEKTNANLCRLPVEIEQFTAISPECDRIPNVEQIQSRVAQLPAKRLIIIVLSGGMGTRSGGGVSPSTLVRIANKGERSLIGLQLERLRRSALRDARVLLLVSPMNKTSVSDRIRLEHSCMETTIYTSGVVPRMSIRQPQDGLIEYRDQAGQPIYNPAGHLDAIRWLAIERLLDNFDDDDVIVTMSYSNWGAELFDETTLLLASYAQTEIESTPGRLFMAEVTSAAITKKTGSILVRDSDQSETVRLIKHAYCCATIMPPIGAEMLMSTNTLYFPVSALRERIGRGDRDLVTATRQGQEGFDPRGLLGASFDKSLPVVPYLSLKPLLDGTETIQAERDLDQLSLVDQAPLIAVRVSAERTQSVKYKEQLASFPRWYAKLMARY